MRHILAWYFSSLSLVNVVYGSLAGTVVALLSFEIGALLLLFGAQVIAEFERHAPYDEDEEDDETDAEDGTGIAMAK